MLSLNIEKENLDVGNHIVFVTYTQVIVFCLMQVHISCCPNLVGKN